MPAVHSTSLPCDSQLRPSVQGVDGAGPEPLTSSTPWAAGLPPGLSSLQKEQVGADLRQSEAPLRTAASPGARRGSHLGKGHRWGQPFPDLLHPLLGNAEGGEVRHHPANAVLRHEGGQRVFGEADEQVEGNAELLALLEEGRGGNAVPGCHVQPAEGSSDDRRTPRPGSTLPRATFHLAAAAEGPQPLHLGTGEGPGSCPCHVVGASLPSHQLQTGKGGQGCPGWQWKAAVCGLPTPKGTPVFSYASKSGTGGERESPPPRSSTGFLISSATQNNCRASFHPKGHSGFPLPVWQAQCQGRDRGRCSPPHARLRGGHTEPSGWRQLSKGHLVHLARGERLSPFAPGCCLFRGLMMTFASFFFSFQDWQQETSH